MVAPHPIKEFNEEPEPKDRRCLFCKRTPPDNLKTNDMTWERKRTVGWYSNALLTLDTRDIVRFYICDKHFDRVNEAWAWAKEGFIEKEIHELKGMTAVERWLRHHPELRRLARGSV